MVLRLSDIQAPAWVWNTGVPDEAPIRMKPLSLATFAEAELMGCGLDALTSGSTDAWVYFYAFLRGDHPDAVAEEVAVHPQAFATFIQHVQTTLPSPNPDDGGGHVLHRRSKDPRTQTPPADSADQPPSTDYTLLFDLARYTKLPLGDIYQMTFKGLAALVEHLESNPPAPSLFGE